MNCYFVSFLEASYEFLRDTNFNLATIWIIRSSTRIKDLHMRRLKPQWTIIWPITFSKDIRMPHQCILYKTFSICATRLGQSLSTRRLDALKKAYNSVETTKIIVHAIIGDLYYTSTNALYLSMNTRKRNQ